MSKISVLLLARNEEQNIEYCLKSIQWCDEIIVVDMDSQDKTAEIAKKYTKLVFHHDYVPAFDSVRNFALQKCTGDWIFCIDADEVVTLTLKSKLLKIIDENKYDVIQVPFKTYIFGKWIRFTGWWPDYHARLFRKGFLVYTESIHEYVKINKDARTLVLPAVEDFCIYHFNYRDIPHFLEKLNKYTTLESQKLSNKIHFSVLRMVGSGVNTFIIRYVKFKGYKDGVRGLFLSILMTFYRIISHMKLWEIEQISKNKYLDYNEIRDKIIS